MGNDQSKAAQAAQEYSNYANHARRGSLLGRNSMASPGPYSAPASAPPPYSVIQEEPQSGAVPFPPQNSPTSNYNPYRAGTYNQQQPQQQPVAHRRAASHAGYGSPPVAGSSHARMNTVARAGRHSMPHSASPPPAPPTRQPSIAAAAPPPPAAGANLARRNSKEDALLMLAKYDTVIIVDDSSSMEGPLWFEAREALAGVADIAGKYDSDGIDIHFLNDDRVGKGFSKARDVERLFDLVHPRGITPTGEKLEILLLDYLLKLEDAKEAANAGDPRPLQAIKPVNFIIITDGAPTDDPESVIVAAARRLDAGRFPITQVGIQFVQIGNDPGAKEALQELDDDLAGRYGIRDIVDTTPYSGQQLDAQTLTKILLGGINKRVDRRGAV